MIKQIFQSIICSDCSKFPEFLASLFPLKRFQISKIFRYLKTKFEAKKTTQGNVFTIKCFEISWVWKLCVCACVCVWGEGGGGLKFPYHSLWSYGSVISQQTLGYYSVQVNNSWPCAKRQLTFTQYCYKCQQTGIWFFG